MPQLRVLDASDGSIVSFIYNDFPLLEYLNLDDNDLVSVECIAVDTLTFLSIGSSLVIQKATPSPTNRHASSRRTAATKSLLRSSYVSYGTCSASNSISSFTNRNLPTLQYLKARFNPIRNFSGNSFPMLKTLDLMLNLRMNTFSANQMPVIEDLYLSACNLTQFECVGRDSLRSLYLSKTCGNAALNSLTDDVVDVLIGCQFQQLE